MKKRILFMMLAGSVSLLEACNSGNASKDAADSVKDINNYNVSNIDSSKTTTSTGGATLIDYSASGGVKMKKGMVTTRTTMEAPAPASEPTPVAAADTAKKDTTKK